MKDPNCRYCTRTTDIIEIAADLEVSTLYITKDQAYRGRCILALKEHKTELFQLSPEDAAAFVRDMSRASKALFEVFSPDKINYAAFGDTYPHLHFHLVPKYKGGKSWGSPFDLPLDPTGIMPPEELTGLIEKIKNKL
ncbi:MAG: HIT family protein [Treponema sp.]|jgi:diadenosine tetraphosphate (Ap4A) HIT family hydrolase|nr:HIT family protein [Treponema sp.]